MTKINEKTIVDLILTHVDVDGGDWDGYGMRPCVDGLTAVDAARAILALLTPTPDARDERIAELERLLSIAVNGLQAVKLDAEVPQASYDRNGPTWTTKSGREVEDTSTFLEKCNELAKTAEEALEAITKAPSP